MPSFPEQLIRAVRDRLRKELFPWGTARTKKSERALSIRITRNSRGYLIKDRLQERTVIFAKDEEEVLDRLIGQLFPVS